MSVLVIRELDTTSELRVFLAELAELADGPVPVPSPALLRALDGPRGDHVVVALRRRGQL